MKVPEFTPEIVEAYLQSRYGQPVTVTEMAVLGHAHASDVKAYGYGVPLKITFRLQDGQSRAAVLHTISPGPFGHEHMADRAQELIWEHRAFNCLPRHVRSLDLAAIAAGGRILSLGGAEEFCLLTEYVDGQSYAAGLERIRDTGLSTESDNVRAQALCDYLSEIHRVRGPAPGLYLRRVRELVGSGECIMGIADSYPPHPLATPALLERIEHLCVSWRWRLKDYTHRLRQVHGDFHPWNILFRTDQDFTLLDRSRGEYGEPADDVTSLTLNYFFFSLQRSGKLEGPFEKMFLNFWRRYVEKTGDREVLDVAAPFFAFRGLVMASPLWYPDLPDHVRRKLLTFVLAVLESGSFDPAKMNSYCGA